MYDRCFDVGHLQRTKKKCLQNSTYNVITKQGGQGGYSKYNDLGKT